MLNLMLLVPIAGIVLVIWGLTRHSPRLIWVGAGLVSVFILLSLIDWLLGA